MACRTLAPDRIRFLSVRGVEMFVREWGSVSAPAIIAWHGFGRTGADFAAFGTRFRDEYRVIAPDSPGRGRSQWLTPEMYGINHSEQIARQFVRVVLPETSPFVWLGSSMGGALGILLASDTLKGRCSHLVLNDIGPTVPPAAIQRIQSYSATVPRFTNHSEAEAYFRRVYSCYGWLSDEEWLQLTLSSVRRSGDGTLTVHYDPAILQAFADHSQAFDCWDRYRSLSCPTLIIRGEHSDLLPVAMTRKMVRANRHADLLVVPNCGHAPALNTPQQLVPIAEFLRRKK